MRILFPVFAVAAFAPSIVAGEQLDCLEIGDKVIVKHTDEIALSIVKPGANINAQTNKE